VLPLCGAHHTALFFIAFRHNHDGHDVKSRVRMPLSTLFIGIVRRAGCGMQEASRDGHGVVNIEDGYIVGDNERQVTSADSFWSGEWYPCPRPPAVLDERMWEMEKEFMCCMMKT
jgi:hypothetical protein